MVWIKSSTCDPWEGVYAYLLWWFASQVQPVTYKKEYMHTYCGGLHIKGSNCDLREGVHAYLLWLFSMKGSSCDPQEGVHAYLLRWFALRVQPVTYIYIQEGVHAYLLRWFASRVQPVTYKKEYMHTYCGGLHQGFNLWPTRRGTCIPIVVVCMKGSTCDPREGVHAYLLW